jgi:hypothetical protein
MTGRTLSELAARDRHLGGRTTPMAMRRRHFGRNVVRMTMHARHFDRNVPQGRGVEKSIPKKLCEANPYPFAEKTDSSVTNKFPFARTIAS